MINNIYNKYLTVSGMVCKIQDCLKIRIQDFYQPQVGVMKGGEKELIKNGNTKK